MRACCCISDSSSSSPASCTDARRVCFCWSFIGAWFAALFDAGQPPCAVAVPRRSEEALGPSCHGGEKRLDGPVGPPSSYVGRGQIVSAGAAGGTAPSPPHVPWDVGFQDPSQGWERRTGPIHQVLSVMEKKASRVSPERRTYVSTTPSSVEPVRQYAVRTAASSPCRHDTPRCGEDDRLPGAVSLWRNCGRHAKSMRRRGFCCLDGIIR
jgi:hypothetical protein